MSQPKDQIHTTEQKRQKVLALIEAVERLNELKHQLPYEMLMHSIESIRELAKEAQACITITSQEIKR